MWQLIAQVNEIEEEYTENCIDEGIAEEEEEEILRLSAASPPPPPETRNQHRSELCVSQPEDLKHGQGDLNVARYYIAFT